MATGYRDGIDYEAEINAAKKMNMSQSTIDNLTKERTNKIIAIGATKAKEYGVDYESAIREASNAGVGNDQLSTLENTRNDIIKKASSGQLTNWGNPTTTNKYTAPVVAPVVAPAVKAPVVNSNESLISGEYKNLISALKAQIQQNINNKQQNINKLSQTYQPMKDDSEVRKSNDLRTALEQSANMGDRGGIGRQNALETQTSGEGRINSINLQQQNAEETLRNDIANLTLEGDVQAAQLSAQKLRDLIADNNRVNDTSYSRSRDTVSDTRYADETSYSKLRDAVGDTRYDDQTAYNRKKEADDTAWSQNANNPAVKAQMLTNSVNELKLTRLLDPNSAENKITAAELESIQFELEQAKQMANFAPQEAELKLDEIRSRINSNNALSSQRNSPEPTTTESKSDQSGYYEGFIAENSSVDGEALYNNLASNSDAYMEAMGPANYNKAIQYAQDKYYSIVVDRWRGNYNALQSELQNKPDYYRQVLGQENYNKLMSID